MLSSHWGEDQVMVLGRGWEEVAAGWVHCSQRNPCSLLEVVWSLLNHDVANSFGIWDKLGSTQ